MERHLGRNTLKRSPAQRIDVLQPVLVEVLTLPNIRVIGLQSTETGDVDVKTRVDIDPACIDDILSLSALALAGPRINVQEVFSFPSGIRRFVLDDSVVVVVGEVGERGVGDLGVYVPIPGQDLINPLDYVFNAAS